jgi:hypothetical protein
MNATVAVIQNHRCISFQRLKVIDLEKLEALAGSSAVLVANHQVKKTCTISFSHYFLRQQP